MKGFKLVTRRLGVLAAIPVVVAVSTSVAAQSADESMAPMGELPAYSVTLSGLDSGATITDHEVSVGVEPIGYTFSCALAGKANAEGIGHYHTILDGALIDMECTPTTTISLQNVAAGPHTLIGVPALDDHEEVQTGAASIDFTYAPTDPLPEITADDTTAAPTISIVSPAPGTEVSGDFTITVAVTDFTLSEALFGKANVSGFGHWHANVDSTTGPMMGMATMLGMSGSETFQASTDGLPPGPHTFFAILVDNQHAPLMPEVIAKVDLVVK